MIHQEKREKISARPTFQSCIIFNENLAGVKQIKEMPTLNKPSYVGACIMDLNKPRMHDFRIHYGYFLKNIWYRWCKITIQSTDLLRYHVKTDGVYKDLSLNQTTFDDGDHDKNSKCYFDYHKKRAVFIKYISFNC